MFENLVAQPVSALLMDDISASRLPPSILFSGQSSSGKLTAALELARVLSCAAGASWTCPCPSCQRHKELLHPDLLVLGPRDCILEIRAAAATLLRDKGTAARYLFTRSVRKLTIRFSPALVEADDSRLSKAAPILAELEEKLEEIDLSRPLPEDQAVLERIVSSIVDAAEKLEDDFLYESIPVSLVRGVSVWARLSPSGKKKVVIIENADCMQESARNAFLKILEEPPADVVFILTTSRRGAIMPTILSRVRTYAFVDRNEAAQQEVIARVFRDSPEPGELLGGYFNRYLPVRPDAITAAVRMFMNRVLEAAIDEGRRPLPAIRCALGQNAETATIQEINASMNRFKPGIVYQLFLSRCARMMRESLRSCSPDARETAVYAKWSSAIQSALDAVAVYNLSPVSTLERLFQSMKDAV
jgi:DNA polymerase-3 subunit gamma/tau